jgi:hypothetical protein
MTKENDESDDQTAPKKPEACPRLPPQRPRRRQQRHKRDRNAGLRGRNTGHAREGLALARHRNGVHRQLEQTVVCEIPDPLPVGVRELEVFAALLGDSVRRALADPE